MKAVTMLLIVGVLTVGAGFYYSHAQNTIQATPIVTKANTIESSEAVPPPCKCYCGGKGWDPGATACMGGFKMRCNNKPVAPGVPGGGGSSCGWDNIKNGKDDVHCDGGEQCK